MQQGPKTFIAGSGPDDLWEIATKSEMSGMSIPGQTSQVCIKKPYKIDEIRIDSISSN